MVQDMVPFTGQLIDSIDIHRPQWMALVDWQVFGFAIYLACTGKDDLGVGITVSTGFQEGKLATNVDLQIREGIFHAVGMADLSCQIENDFLVLNKVSQTVFVAHIGDVDPNLIFDAGHIKEITAVFSNQRVDQQHICSQAY